MQKTSTHRSPLELSELILQTNTTDYFSFVVVPIYTIKQHVIISTRYSCKMATFKLLTTSSSSAFASFFFGAILPSPLKPFLGLLAPFAPPPSPGFKETFLGSASCPSNQSEAKRDGSSPCVSGNRSR